MSLENQFNKKSPEPFMVSTGIEKDGTVRYEEWAAPLPEKYSHIPDEVFKEVVSDLNSLPENNKPMKFHKGEYLSLSINSGGKTPYEIIDARKGYYFIARIYSHGEGRLEFLTSKEPRNNPNPFIVVCSEEEVENWLK